MISVDGLTVEFGGTTLFSDISFQINEKDRIALMGKNGAGKSTLLKILAGVRQPSRGKVSAPKDCVIAYLPQHLMTEDGRTVFEEASQAFSHLHVMEAEIEAINKELETRTDYESDSYMELIEKVSAMSEKFYSIDLTHFEEDVEKALLGLGFMREDFNRPTSDFSGGWRMRIELAKLLLQNPDVLLLDEPTNHLDIESIQWLEDFLIDNGQAVVVISHDRAFVRRLATRIVEVDRSQLYSYACTFDQFLERREERLDAEEKQAAAFDKKLAQEEAWIRQGIKARRTRNMGRVRALQAMRSERMARVSRQGVVSMLAQEAERSGKLVIEAKQAGFAYPDGYRVFNAFSTIIQRGDRIGLIGNNGVGKTTSIAKLADYYTHQGKKVMLAAGDTFRAAASEQLEIWAGRAGVPIVKAGEGADPAAVIFDTVKSATARGYDMVIADTAGRLHNKSNLMSELSKISRSVRKAAPEASLETLLVLDAITGQNAISQAKEFCKAADATGIILTKLDGTAKGGCVVAVKQRLGLPVRFIGVGEGIDDLIPFTPEGFVEELIPRTGWKH